FGSTSRTVAPMTPSSSISTTSWSRPGRPGRTTTGTTRSRPPGHHVPTVDKLLVRESGSMNPGDAGKGFLIDRGDARFVGTQPAQVAGVAVQKPGGPREPPSP